MSVVLDLRPWARGASGPVATESAGSGPRVTEPPVVTGRGVSADPLAGATGAVSR